jgi:hypothetical protein
MNAPDLALIGFVAIIVIILAFAFLVLWHIVAGTIKLDGLIAELDPAQPELFGKASLSRFQFLIFTFVVAGLFLLLSIETGAFVTVPGDVLGLLGISGGTFVVSKAMSGQAAPRRMLGRAAPKTERVSGGFDRAR